VVYFAFICRVISRCGNIRGFAAFVLIMVVQAS